MIGLEPSGSVANFCQDEDWYVLPRQHRSRSGTSRGRQARAERGNCGETAPARDAAPALISTASLRRWRSAELAAGPTNPANLTGREAATPWDRGRSYAHDRGSFDTE